MSSSLSATLLGAAALSLGTAALAQNAAAPDAAGRTLSTVTVTGNPLGADTLVVPSETLTGDGLALRTGPTLGETLDGLPGVASTYYGPNASRPVIRGQDGDRIRILQNGGATVDASGLSFDHAVPAEPLTT